jgi:hypothetical protein
MNGMATCYQTMHLCTGTMRHPQRNLHLLDWPMASRSRQQTRQLLASEFQATQKYCLLAQNIHFERPSCKMSIHWTIRDEGGEQGWSSATLPMVCFQQAYQIPVFLGVQQGHDALLSFSP